ncbi:MAG: hypothetical protein AAF224_09445 [Pseudomonadota bacterium]
MARAEKFPLRPSRRGVKELTFWNLFQGSEVRADPRIQRLLTVLDIIDVKAGPLVFYNGLLLVIATILIGNSNYLSASFEQISVIAPLILFVLFLFSSLIYALRTIYIIGAHNKYIMRHTDESGYLDNSEVAVNLLADIVANRRRRYMVAYRLAAFSTFLLVVHLGARFVDVSQLQSLVS